jgi:DNA polymerase-3 subunit epsilon
MKKILIIDIETSNFLQKGGKIVEIGIVELNLENGEKKIIFDEICHEDGITREECDASWIVKNSTLTTEEIRTSKHLRKYKAKIQKIINRYPLGATAYNNVFDFDFFEDRGFVFVRKLDCPMKLSTNICKIRKKKGRGYKWPSCEEAYNFFFPEREYIEQHRGADDAFYEADIVQKLYEMSIFRID